MERLVRDYGERAFQFAFRLAGNAEDAGEIVQEAFFRVLRHWGRYDPDQPLENWFFAILRRVFLDSMRRGGRRRAVSLDAPAGDGASTYDEIIEDRSDRVLESLEREESGRKVRGALERLPVDQRAILFLIDVEGLRYEEAARVLDCPIGTVRSRVSRARNGLRSLLLEEAEACDR